MTISNIYYRLPHKLRRNLYSIFRRDKFNNLQHERAQISQTGYTLKSFDEHKCIFIHIPKAAGVSVCKSLFGNLCAGHTPVKRYQLIYSPEEFETYFKFTFVRNPWDRVLSAYNFLKQGGMSPGDKKWASENIIQYRTFEEFVKNWLTEKNILGTTHFRPQYTYLSLPGSRELLVNFLGYFENLNEDFEYIKSKLDVDQSICLKHSNKVNTSSTRYVDQYTDECRDIVSLVYADDIELLGYSFDNSSLRAQLASRQ